VTNTESIVDVPMIKNAMVVVDDVVGFGRRVTSLLYERLIFRTR